MAGSWHAVETNLSPDKVRQALWGEDAPNVLDEAVLSMRLVRGITYLLIDWSVERSDLLTAVLQEQGITFKERKHE